MGGQYEFDKESFRFRKVTRSIWSFVKKVVAWFSVSVSMAVVIYLVFAAFFSTDTEKQLRRENRLFEQMYPEMRRRASLVGDVVEDLSRRDDEIYEQIFHSGAPMVNPSSSFDMVFGSDSIPDKDLVEYTWQKAESLSREASRTEENFLRTFAALSASRGKLPPMRAPLEGITYARIGAGTGEKLNPFYKVMTRHDGLDIIAPQGEKVYASAAGTVRDVIRDGKGLGNVVEIDHGNGYVTRYAHLSDIVVMKGQRVPAGKQIAKVGISGNSFAPHLHYEVLHDGQPADPTAYLFASLSPQAYADMIYMSISTGQSLD